MTFKDIDKNATPVMWLFHGVVEDDGFDYPFSVTCDGWTEIDIQFTGGEPPAYFDFAELEAYCYEKVKAQGSYLSVFRYK